MCLHEMLGVGLFWPKGLNVSLCERLHGFWVSTPVKKKLDLQEQICVGQMGFSGLNAGKCRKKHCK